MEQAQRELFAAHTRAGGDTHGDLAALDRQRGAPILRAQREGRIEVGVLGMLLAKLP